MNAQSAMMPHHMKRRIKVTLDVRDRKSLSTQWIGLTLFVCFAMLNIFYIFCCYFKKHLYYTETLHLN